MPEKLIRDKRKFVFPLAIFLIMAVSAALWLPKYGGGAVDVEYQQIAINMLDGHGFSLGGERTMAREPFYPFFLFLNYKIFGVHNYLIYFEQFLLLLLICFFTYKLAVKFFGGAVAKIAVLAVAIHPLFVIYAVNMSSEMAAAFLVSFSCFFFVKSLEGEKLRSSFLAGAGLALLVLTKTIFIFIPFFLVLFYFFRPSDKKLAKILIFFFAFFILILPWVYRNHVYFGKWGITERGGAVVYLHALRGGLDNAQFKNYAISALLSQYFVRLGDPSFDIFKIEKEPYNKTLEYYEGQGYSFGEIDSKIFFEEAKKLWITHPVKNLLVGFLEFSKNNSPTVPRDSVVYVHTVPNGAFAKIFRGMVIIFIRLAWLAVLLLIFYGAYKTIQKKAHCLIPLILFIVYLNGLLFFLDGMPRHIFPIYSLYFIFFALGFCQLRERFLAFKLKNNYA